MKYFLLKSDPKYTDMPWFKTIPKGIDVRNIRIEEAHKLPQSSIAPIYESPYTVYIDVMSKPFLLLSECCMDVVKMYEPFITTKQMVLMDSKNKSLGAYYLPILPRIECLTKKSIFNLDKSYIEYAELDLSKIGKHVIFHLADTNSTYTVIRLDMVESMLKRGARGLFLTELDTIQGDS